MLRHFVVNPEELVLFGGEDGLAPLRLSHLVPGGVLPFHIFTATDSLPGGFVLTWRRGQALPPKLLERVWGYFAVAEAGEVLNYLLSRIEFAEVWGETPEALELLADTLLVWTQHFFCHDAARTPASLDEAKSLIKTLASGLEDSPHPLETIGALRRHDSGVFSHCLNVCLLTLAFARLLPWKQEEVETLALATLLHDLGMMPWAQEAFHQTTPLSDQDWEKIKAHPDRGADLLQVFADLPEEMRLTVRQHHENADGTGYPLGLAGEAIHPWAKVLRVLDSYEAVTSLRPWRPPIGERQAWRIMSSVWNAQGSYDPEYLRLFLAFCQGRQEKCNPRLT